MKQKECNIVQDLLLNYLDGVLTKDSKDFVDEHLRKCKDCQEKLNDMKEDSEEIQKKGEEKEIDFLRSVKKKISKRNKFIIIIAILLIIIITINVLIYMNYRRVANEIKIFLNDDITREEMEAIKDMITTQDNKAEITYNSKEDELEEMKEKFKENANLLNGYEVKNIFPASFNVKTKIESTKNIGDAIISMPGVKNVSSYIYRNPYEVFITKCLLIFKKN